MARSRAAHSF
ncbi:hypothetical protein AZE42_12522, partial [Rhizopogon vesiculosus]